MNIGENRKRYFKYLGIFALKYVVFGVVVIMIAKLWIEAKFGDKMPIIIRYLSDPIHVLALCILIKINKHVDLIILSMSLLFGILFIYGGISFLGSQRASYIFLGIGLILASFVLLRVWWNGIGDYDKEDPYLE